MAINFEPEDFDSVYTLSDLVEVLSTIILDIRGSQNSSYTSLRQNIQELENLSRQIEDNTNLQVLFSIYEKEKKISLEMRSLLSQFINIDTYDSIEYVFYYNNQRYVTNHIDASWLVQRGKGSELSLDLDKAAQGLAQQYKNKAISQIQQVFNEHYLVYLNRITETYNGVLGRGRLNKGHVAEAFESHLAEHHTQAYNLLNSVSITNQNLTTMEKIILSNTEEARLHESNWDTHEGMTMAWFHIKNSLGTQRGTVAGDVGRFQVKQGSNNTQFSSFVRLSSLTNLKTGISTYCDIFSDKPVEVVARQLAMYLTEPIKKTSQNVQAYALNKEIAPLLNDFEKLRHI